MKLGVCGLKVDARSPKHPWRRRKPPDPDSKSRAARLKAAIHAKSGVKPRAKCRLTDGRAREKHPKSPGKR